MFQKVGYNPTYSRLTHFFLKTKVFDFPDLNSNKLNGKYVGSFSKYELFTYFKKYLIENGFTLHGAIKDPKKYENCQQFAFSKEDLFNNFSDNEIEILKNEIDRIGVVKTENLSGYIINARKNYKRAYEIWTEKEIKMLEQALAKTNDLSLLALCFQRGNGSIISCSQKIILEKEAINQL